jgi:hypothetical protein
LDGDFVAVLLEYVCDLCRVWRVFSGSGDEEMLRLRGWGHEFLDYHADY